MHRKDLLFDLAERGLVKVEQAEQALENPQFSTMPLDEALVEAQLVDPERLAQALSTIYGLKYVDLDSLEIEPKIRSLLPRDVCRNYGVVPVGMEGSRLQLAMADPLDVNAEDVVTFVTGLSVERRVASRAAIRRLVETSSQSDDGPVLQRILGKLDSQAAELVEEETSSDEYRESDGPIIQLVNTLIGDGVACSASDIHIEPQANSVNVRYRQDGLLRAICSLPRRSQKAMVSRIKLMAQLDIAESRVPQDGRFKILCEGREVDIRANTLPSVYGEKVVLRLLDQSVALLPLDALGLDSVALVRCRQLLSTSQGMIMVTGPTGSGKTSTLYACLNELNTVERNIVTVEDPVEFQVPQLTQVAIRPKQGLDFGKSLRAILRQDPDVIMVGEIRDLETAEIAFHAAQTGHLVLSTLHTNSAAATVARLGHMGMPPFVLASSLLGILAQRLARRICSGCREKVEPDLTLLGMLQDSSYGTLPTTFYKGKGCTSCSGTGYKGRVALFELLEMRGDVRKAVIAGASESEIEERAVASGMVSLIDDGLQKIESGQTTVEEVIRVATGGKKG